MNAVRSGWRRKKGILALMLVLSIIFGLFIPVSAENDNDEQEEVPADGGFSVSLSWTGGDVDPVEYNYDSVSSETRLVRLKVSYHNDKLLADYAKGRIVISVPGINDVLRRGEAKPVAIAADKADDTYKIYDWSYTYNSSSGIYTFTNNDSVTKDAVYDGMFEIVWSIPSASSLNGYSKTLQATLQTERGENTQSGEVTYSQTRKRDEYFLTPQSATYDPASRVYSSEGLAGLIMPGKTEDDYRFIRYSGFRYSKRSYSRSVTGDSGSTLKADFSVWVPTGVSICGSRGTENGPDQFTKTGNTKTIDGVLYNEWRISGATVTAYGTSGLMFFAAYPNETYLGQNVKVYLEAYGKYYDETERVKLAEQVYTANTGDYDYLENGTVYLAGLTVRGVRNSYADSHCSDCRSNGCINAEDIGIRQTVYSSDILFSCYENSGETFEIGLDRFQVKTAEGNNRFLNDDEYHYKAIVLPSLSGKTNINEIVTHSETYDTEIYVRHAGAEAYELYSDEYKLDGSSHTVQFTDTDIAAVSVRIKSVDQSFQGLVFLSDYVFHSSQDDIQLDNGMLRHYLFVRRFDSDGRLIPDTEDTVLLPGDEQYFSEPVYREYDDSHILIIPNILRTSASLSQESHTSTQYLFDASVTDIFDVPDGNNVTAFTVYTVIPDGIHIQELYSTEAEFADHISLTGLFLEEGVLKEHMTLRILERTNTAGRVRKYLEMKFDFSDAPIINNGSSSRKYTLKIKNIPLAVNIDEINQRQEGGLDPKTFNYWLYTMTTIDQEGFWYADHTDSLTYEDGMWRDIDGDGDTAEKIAFSSAITGFTVAGFAQLESVISVRTGLSNGFVRPDYDSLAQTFSNVPEVYGAHPYTYRIKFRGNQDQVGSIVIVDSIESDAASEWQGTLLGVDTSNITAFTGIEPVVYWSRSEEDDTVRPDLSDTSKWSVLPADISGWTEEQRAAIRTIAVDLGEATLTRGQYILLDLLLDSPDNSCGDHNYKMTVNKCGVHFKTIDEQTGLELEDICQASSKIAVQIDPYMGTVKIRKKDHDDASPLSGVKFNLYNKSDGSFYSGGIVTDSSGQAVVRNVPYGRYYLKELQSKKGYYLLSEPIDVELTGSIPGITVNVDIDNIRRPTSVKLTKTSDRDNSPLPGAVFRLHKADGSYQNDTLYTTDADGMLYVTDVPWGSYYLEETEPPAGYEITDEAENIPFTVKAENNAGAELSLKVKNRQLPGQVRMYKYERLENRDATTTPVGGAFYELYDSGDELLGTYMTDNNGLLYVEDLDFGSYYFIESVPATGYGLNGDRIDFTVDGEDLQADGTVVQELTTYDQRLTGSFFIQKRDDREELVKGAAYGLFRQSDDVRVDAQGNEITNTMSDYGLFVTDDAGSVTVRNVYWGDYYLMEVEAPTGYALNTTKYPVSVNRNTVYNVIRINATDERLKGSVLLIKADKDDLTRRLPGAVYSLYKSSGSLVRSGITTGDDGTVLINDIPWGTYYLEEEVPPEGFGLSDEKVRFTVNYLSAGKTQEITAEDKQASGELKIKKRIALDDVVLAHGEPTFIFEINGTSSVDGQTYRASKSVTFSEEYISSLIQNGNVQYAEMTALFTDIPTGTCTVSETEVQRYELSRISEVSQNGATGQNNTVTFNITNEALQCSATFTNVKTVQSKASHTAAEINMLKKARRITSMSAVWTGKPYYTETVLDRSLLDVFIVFDDGTTEKLGDNEYELWNGDQQLSQPDTDDFETDTIADVTIDVRFTNAGRTYSDSFDLTIMMEMPVTMFTYSVTDGPFTDGEAYYDGTAVITGYLGDSTNISIPKTVIGERKLTDPYSGEYEDHYSAKQYKVIGIESIEEYEPAYGFAYAETVVLPSTVSMIGDYAFCNNSSLNDIDLSNITDIGKQAFYYNTGLTEADLSSAVNIGDSAFYGCTGIEEADLVNIRTIGDEAFYDCSEISVINIGDDVYSVGENAFVGTAVYDAADNGVYYLGEGRVLAGHKGYSSSVPSEFTVADGTLCIADSALPSCGIEELNLPDTLKYIGKNAFAENNMYELNIPDSVLEIRDRAFYDCVSLEEIIIPDSVVLIGDYSFYCGYNAERIVIGNGVRTIGDYAFFDHYDVSELTLGSSIETIGEGAFGYLGSIKEAVIPDSVVTIGDRAFTDCGSLENLVIGNGVTYIGEEAFTWCGNSSSEDYGDEHTHMEVTFGTGLKTIADSAFYYSGITGPPSGDPSKGNALILPEGLESIGRYAFSECPHLGYVYLPDSITFMDESAFSGYSKASCTNGMWTDNIPAGLSEISPWVFYGSAMGPDVVFPDTLTRIGERAFSENSAIETLTFSDSLTAIDDDAFYQCVNLDGTVNITKGITEIGKNPFAYCTSLDAFSVDAQNESFTAVDGILYTKDVTELVAYPAGRSLDGYVMPDTVTKIRPGAFDGCTGGSFTLSQNLLEIPAYAFYHSSISEITIPDTVIKIGEYAFSYCSNLQSIVVPDSVTTMGSGVFYYSTSLQSAVIGSGMTEIPSSTFNNCTSLRDLTLSGSVTTISASAFAKCTSLEEIELPSQLTSFGNNAFDGCTSLQSIDIPDGVTALSNYLFNNCSSLASVEYPDELVSVGSYTFSGCTSLSSAALPASVKTIGTYAFNNCSGLRQVSYPLGTLTSLGTYAFKGCSSLTEIIIPYSINAVPAGLCYGCTGLTSIKYALRSEYEPGYDPDTTPDTNVRQINSSAFTNCSSMTVFSVPDSVRVIDQSAFSGWTKLRVLTFSESMTKIGSNAFSGCTSLEEVTIGGPVSESNAMKNIFGNNNSIKKVVIIDGVTTLGSYAFRGCTELEDITIPNTVMYTSKYSKKVNNYTYYYTDAFAGLTKIKHVTIGETINYDYNNTIGGTSYYSISNMFSDSRTSITSITVLDGVTRLMGSFGGCPNLTSFTIPDSVTYLASSFSGDTSLTDITIPDSVACITTNFSGTPIYTSVYNAASAGDLIYILNGKILCGYKGSPRPSGEIVVPEGTEYILPSAFNNCTDLSSLSLPSTIKCLGGSAFSDCYLRDITFKTMKNIRYMGSHVFDYSPFTYNHNVEGKVYADSSGVIYIKAQDGSKILYATDSRGRGTMTVEDNTYVIAGGVLSYILRWNSSGSSFTGITIPSTVKSIGPSAFNKSSLTSLSVPGTVKYIWDGAFSNSTSLKSITLGNGISEIGQSDFSGCKNTSLTSITIPNSVYYLGRSAFEGCTNIRTLNIGSGIRAINEQTFKDTNISVITIPDNIRVIAARAFYSSGQTVTTQIVIGNGTTAIGTEAFANLKGVTSIKLSKNLVSIGIKAFINLGATSRVQGDIMVPWKVTYAGGTYSSAAFYQAKVTGRIKNAQGIVVAGYVYYYVTDLPAELRPG